MKFEFLRKLKLGLGLTLALSLSSCLQTETTINLNKDGSGTIVDKITLGAKMLEMMTQFTQPGQPDPIADMFSEEKAKAKAAKMGTGIEFVKAEMIDKDGKKGAIIHYKFADINTLDVRPAGGMEDIEGGAEDDAETDKKKNIKFKYTDGKLSIIMPPANFEDMDMDQGGEQNPEMEKMMTDTMADMRMTLKLNIVDGIEESTATHIDGSTITLADVQVGKLSSQKDAIKKISETSKTDMDGAKEAFSKLEGIKMEMKPEVSVTLK